MRLLRTVMAALVAGLLVTACSAGTPPSPSPSAPAGPTVIPLLISQELGVGPNRMLFGLIDPKSNEQLADPDRTMRVGFTGPAGEAVGPVDARFIWAIENERGVYAAEADFPVAGAWTAVFETAAAGAPPERIQFSFDVVADTSVLRAGERAPSVDTPTADDVGGDLSKLSTDTEPVAGFYERSIADAVAAGEPFVVAFATPRFCATNQCGPTLDRLKPIAAAHPGVTFINVEPYLLEVVEGQLQPVLSADQQLQPVPAVVEFGMRSEPYLFVVDREGVIRASFEVIFSEDELEAALDAVG